MYAILPLKKKKLEKLRKEKYGGAYFIRFLWGLNKSVHSTVRIMPGK